jgi:hypothetical protein
MNKGYYLKKDKKDNIILNIFVADFVAYLQDLEAQNGWVNLKIYERDRVASNGLTLELKQLTGKVEKQK